jgi:gas vesicle protein
MVGNMNPRILMLASGVAIGYVLGTRAGRERYEQIKARATALWEDPRVAKARRDVEAYAREQAPIIRERAEAAAKAAPGVAKDVAANVSTTAKDVAGRASASAKDAADRVTGAAKDAADRVTGAATNARTQAAKVASDIRNRGGAAFDSAVTTAGEARERALAPVDNEDDDDTGAARRL